MVSEQIAGVGVSGWNFHRLNRHESARFKDATNSKVNKLTTPFQKMSPLVFSIILFWINYNSPRKFEHFKGYLGIHLLPLFFPMLPSHVPRTTAKWLLPPVACQHRGAHSDHVAAQILGAKMLQKVQGPLPPPTGHGPCIGRPGEIYLGKSYIVIIYVI